MNTQKYFLVKVTDAGERLVIAPSYESESLIAAGVKLSCDNPSMTFVVVDEAGAVVWQSVGTRKKGTSQESM